MSAHRSNAAIGADIAKEADKPTPAQLVAEASVVVRLAATQWRPAYALARTIATIGDLQSAVTDLAAETARLKEHLERVIGWHSAPGDCYSTGPLTGDPVKDLVACPSCAALDFLASLSPAPAKKENEHG